MQKSIQSCAVLVVVVLIDYAATPATAQIVRVPTVDRIIHDSTRVPRASDALGQISNSVRTPQVATFRDAGRPRQKPFSNISRRPTVSPYLNLDRDDSQGLPNYQTLVRPQLDQIETNRRQSRQIQRLGREFNALDQQVQQPQQFSPFIRETGHAATFMNMSHYYPRR